MYSFRWIVTNIQWTLVTFTSMTVNTDPDWLSLPKIWRTRRRSTSTLNTHSPNSCPYIPRPVPNTCGFSVMSWYIIHWQFMSIHCQQVSCESNHTVSTYLWISKWTKLCHGNKRHAVCQIHKNTVLCWNAESYVQNAETLCSKCGNTMLKTRKHYAQNAETLFCDIPSHSLSKILNGSLVALLSLFDHFQ